MPKFLRRLRQICNSAFTNRRPARIRPQRQNRIAQATAEVLETKQLLAADFQLLVDLNTTPVIAGHGAESIMAVGNVTFFLSHTQTHGTELWKSDGTSAGTVMVKDIQPGIGQTYVRHMTNVSGTLFFSASDGLHGQELWKSDGTEAGTVMVKELRPGRYGGNPTHLTNVNGTLYFSASEPGRGHDLWKSDGTTEGTVRVNTSETWVTVYPEQLTNVNGVLFFAADGGGNGRELWKSDGTAAGTVVVKDIQTGGGSSGPESLVNVNGQLYFTADDGEHGRELWVSDGTSAGTSLVTDIVTGAANPDIRMLTAVGNRVFFRANDGVAGHELWTSDGTSAGTLLVSDIFSGSGSSISHYSNLVNVNGTLYFGANDGATGPELWTSDGTSAGTVMVKEIRSGAYGGDPKHLTNVNGTLYFSAWQNGWDVWKSDGTEAGTTRVRDVVGWSSTYPHGLTNVNGVLYFRGSGSTGYGLWKSDGTSAGTGSVRGVVTGTASSTSTYSNHVDVNGTLYFGANDGTHGPELWKTDGTESGTVMVKEIRNGSYGGDPRQLTNVNGTLFFSAWQNGWDIWKSDGTEAGTARVRNVSGWASIYPHRLTSVGGKLFFRGSNEFGYELWVSDGTDAGTMMTKDIQPSGGSDPQSLTDVNGVVFFTAYNEDIGQELWKSDGTAAGTVLVKDIRPGLGQTYIRNMVNVNGTLYFSAQDGTHGQELWKSDGTEAGTVMVRELRLGNYGGNPADMVNVNGTLYFSSSDTTRGRDLWKSDGTADGTVRVIDSPVWTTVYPEQLTNVNGTLFFAADGGGNGREIWKSDGTTAGTVLVRDVFPGEASSHPQQLTNINGTLYFTADLGVDGRQLWKSDGTAEGTVLSMKFTPDSGSAEPREIILSGGNVFVNAMTENYGRELYVRPWTNSGPTNILLSSHTIAENQPASTVVGTLSTSDPDGGDTFVYELVSGTGDDDNGSFAIDGDVLKTTGAFNFETRASYSIRVMSTDAGSLSTSKVLTISVTNVNEQPTGISLTPYWVDENLPAGTLVGTFSTADPDAGNTFEYELVVGEGDGNNSSFVIDGAQLKTAVSFDYESQSTAVIRVRSTDQGGLSFERYLTIHINNGGDVPENLRLTSGNPVTAEMRPEFTWNPIVGSASYELWVRNNGLGLNGVFRKTVIGTTYRPNVDLGIGRYSIWIRSVAQDGIRSAWSSQYQFQITAPVQMGVVTRLHSSMRPTIHWNPLAGASRYVLWLENRTTGESPYRRDLAVTSPTWTPDADLPMGVYRVWVRGADPRGNLGEFSRPVDFVVLPETIPQSPLSSTFERRPTFSWSAVAGAVGYDLILRDVRSGAVLQNPVNITDTTWTPPEDLANGEYRWYVNAVSADGYRSQNAVPVNFSIGGHTALLTPQGAVSGLPIAFTWRAVSGDVTYQLFVSRTDVPVGGIISRTGLAGTSYNHSSALPVGTYRAWVRAVSATGSLGPWSRQADFSMVAAGNTDGSEPQGLTLELAGILDSVLLVGQPKQTVAASQPARPVADVAHEQNRDVEHVEVVPDQENPDVADGWIAGTPMTPIEIDQLLAGFADEDFTLPESHRVRRIN